jgi:hypothetical protein
VPEAFYGGVVPMLFVFAFCYTVFLIGALIASTFKRSSRNPRFDENSRRLRL